MRVPLMMDVPVVWDGDYRPDEVGIVDNVRRLTFIVGATCIQVEKLTGGGWDVTYKHDPITVKPE